MADKLRIAIMDAVPKVYWADDEGHTDGEKFYQLLATQNPAARLDVFYSAEGEFPERVTDYDVYLIGGSPASVHDDDDWIARLADLVVDADAAERRIVASCFGHQLVAKTYGGQVEYNEHGWCIGNYDLAIRRQFDWMEPRAQVTGLYHFNQERVTRLPWGAVGFADSDDYPDYAYTIGERILSFQGHPEQPLRAMNNFMLAVAPELSADEQQRARRMIDRGLPDADTWACWIMRFCTA